MKMALDVVFLSYNRKDDLIKNIKSLINSPYFEDTKIFVVDNGSTDGSCEELEKLAQIHEVIEVIFLERNCGVSAGRNIGYRAGNAELILSLDDDAYFDPLNWKSATQYFSRENDLGVLGLKVLHASSGSEQTPAAKSGEELANYHGAGHIIRRSALEAVGYMDERCYFGGEELDLSMRMRAIKFTTRFASELYVTHNNFPRSGKEGSDRRLHWAYSYGLVLSKNLPPVQALILLWRRWIGSAISYNQRDLLNYMAKSFLSTARGYLNGRKIHKPIGSEAESFYRRSDLLPEFGNIPLYKKLLIHLPKWRFK